MSPQVRTTGGRAPADEAWSAALEPHDCAICGGPTALEVVDCADGHGPECPDRICTGCGVVIVVGPAPMLRDIA